MAIDNATLIPVLDNILEFTQAAIAEHESDQAKITELQNKVAQSERVTLEKVAAARANVLDSDRVNNVLSNLVQMRLLSPADQVKVANKLAEDPNSSLNLITKMAEMLVSPSEGSELNEARDVLMEDPDGWGAMAEGKPVRIRA